MAEAIYRHLQPTAFVQSAGLYAVEGAKISGNSLAVLQDNGIKIHHRASQITADAVKESKVILTMTAAHRNLLVEEYPDEEDKIFTLKKFATNLEGDISDPFGGNLDVYHHTYKEIYDLIELITKDQGDQDK